MESLINIQVYGEHDNMANRYAKMKDASNPFVVGDVVEMAPPRSTHGIVGTVERLVSDFGVQVAWNNGVITKQRSQYSHILVITEQRTAEN